MEILPVCNIESQHSRFWACWRNSARLRDMSKKRLFMMGGSVLGMCRRNGEEAAAILETAAVFIGALVERRGEELSTSSFDFDNITILRLSSNNIAMFIFSGIIIHGLCRFIYNLVAVLYNDILLFKNIKRQGAFWPSGVDFGLYYNNFALILQQSCAPGLFPRPGRAAGGRVH